MLFTPGIFHCWIPRKKSLRSILSPSHIVMPRKEAPKLTVILRGSWGSRSSVLHLFIFHGSWIPCFVCWSWLAISGNSWCTSKQNLGHPFSNKRISHVWQTIHIQIGPEAYRLVEREDSKLLDQHMVPHETTLPTSAYGSAPWHSAVICCVYWRYLWKSSITPHPSVWGSFIKILMCNFRPRNTVILCIIIYCI